MIGIPDIPPGVLLLAAAALLPLLPGIVRSVVTIAAPLLALGLLLGFENGTLVTASFAGFELILLKVDAVNRVFGLIFLLITTVASIYAWHMRDTGQQVAALVYAGGTLVITLAGDFLTLLIGWELMAVASAWLIFARRDPAALRAGFRYLMMHLAGGSALLAGIVLHFSDTGSLVLAPFAAGAGASPAAWLILTGVALNAAVPPLHPWLPDAYPQATITGAVYMSALTTKSAVYVLLTLFAGWDLLIYAGAVMAIYGAVYALLANDIRRILAYSTISQVGYMVTGIGIASELAKNGVVAHAVSHILYKALLFMAAGAIIHATGKSNLSELGGLGRRMRALLVLFLIGACSIAGLPLFNGFVSKSMIVSAAGDAHLVPVFFALFVASVGSFLHTGLRLTVFTFWGTDRNLTPQPLPVTMYAAMGVLAFLCVLCGVQPGLLYGLLPFAAEYHPYTAYHFVETGQLLVFAALAFWLLRSRLAPQPGTILDLDWFYRCGAPLASRVFVLPINAVFDAGARAREAIIGAVVRHFANPRAWFQPRGRAAQPFDPDQERSPIGSSIAFTLLFLVVLSLIVSRL